MPETILEEADRIINGERRDTYGDPLAQETRIAGMWSAYLGLDKPLTPYDVSNMMIMLKISRSKNNTDQGVWHRDSDVDIAGYAGLKEKVAAVEGKAGEPRQWSSLFDIPDGVSAQDEGNWTWTKSNGRLHYSNGGARSEATMMQIENTQKQYQVFTEVLDG